MVYFFFFCKKKKIKTMCHFPSHGQLYTNLCFYMTRDPFPKILRSLWPWMTKCDKVLGKHCKTLHVILSGNRIWVKPVLISLLYSVHPIILLVFMFLYYVYVNDLTFLSHCCWYTEFPHWETIKVISVLFYSSQILVYFYKCINLNFVF